jgi:hypothetical protein
VLPRSEVFQRHPPGCGGGAALTIEELHADLGALSVKLNDDVVQRLDEIWPGPEEAPQTYAC